MPLDINDLETEQEKKRADAEALGSIQEQGNTADFYAQDVHLTVED